MESRFNKTASLIQYLIVGIVAMIVCPVAMADNTPSLAFNGQLAWIANEGPKGSDFDSSMHLAGSVLIPVIPNLSAELGISQTNKATDEGVDNTGRYKLAISGNDLFGGIRFDANALGGSGFFARAGLLYYKSEIEFSESFFGLKPKGSLTDVEEGTGFYLGAGFKFNLGNQLSNSIGLQYLSRQDFFSGSPRAFDMEEIALILAIQFSSFN